MRLVSELRRRNVFRMAALYAVVAWLILQVAGVLIDLAKFPDWIGTTILWLVAVGFPITLIFSWFYEITPEGVSLDKDAGRGIAVTRLVDRRLDFIVISLLCAAIILFAYDKWLTGDPTDRSLAVLPFVNLSNNPENEPLSDGITETLLHALARSRGLRVSARTSSFYFKGQDIDLREIARQLDVSNILKGSVQRDGSRIRVMTQLIEAKTGFSLWSETYDRDMSDIFAVQDDIANSVATAMEITLIGSNGTGGSKSDIVGTRSVAAYEIYLDGLQQQNVMSNKPLLLAEVSFRESLAIDPNFYAARLELANTYSLQKDIGEITKAEARAYIGPLIARLRDERPDDVFVRILDAHIQGLFSIDMEAYLAEIKAAIERMPSEVALYREKGRVLRYLNRHAEAVESLKRGIEFDPFDWYLHFEVGRRLMAIGNVDGAEAAFTRSIELNPNNPTVYLFASEVYEYRNEYATAFAFGMKAMEADPLDNEITASIAAQLYAYGLIDDGDKYMQHALTIAPERPFVQIIKLNRHLLGDDHSKARELSESLLRDDIDSRLGLYQFAAVVFASTMAELGASKQALAVLEELQTGVSSPDFVPSNRKEQELQFAAVLIAAQSQPQEETRRKLDTIVPRWDDNYPGWRNDGRDVAAIEMARGNTELAVDLTLGFLEGPNAVTNLIFHHIIFYKGLAQEPAVAARLAELEVEAKEGGEEILAYIAEHEMQPQDRNAPIP